MATVQIPYAGSVFELTVDDDALAMLAESATFAVDGSKPKPAPVHSINYLLRNGYSQTLRDKAAGVGKDETPEKAKELRNAMAMKRFDTLIDGTVATRQFGPRLDPVEKVRRDVIDAQLAAWATEHNKPLPKKADKLNALRVKWYGNAKRKELVDAEVARRMESAVEVDADDFDVD